MNRAHANGFNVLHLFCGAGGGALGFARAGFRSVGAFDVDGAAIRDHDALTGEPGTVADLATMEPHELRAACTGRPDVVFTSPPCKSFSGCLPAAKATTDRRREGALGVKGWGEASAPVIGYATPHNFPAQLADPRLDHAPRRGSYGVHGWAEPSHAIIGEHRPCKGANVADPRVPTVVGPAFDVDDRSPVHLVIRAADGTWHRPMTTLELAALQSFPVGDAESGWLVLDGRSHRRWRQAIGNAVPPDAAEAIARSMARTLRASADGGLLLDSSAVWVRPLRHAPAP